MTRETKVGLLFGMALILVIGILVSDFLVEPPSAAPMMDFADRAQSGYSSELAGRSGGGMNATTRREISFPLPGLPGALDTGANPNIIDRPIARSVTPPSAVASELTLDQIIAQQERLARYAPPAPQARPELFATNDDPTALFVGRREGDDIPAAQQPIRREQRPDGIWHTVERNESLYQIARKYYNNGEQWSMIRDANPNIVGANGQVREGVRLRIPMPADLTALPQFELVEERTAADALGPGGGRASHTLVVVQPGQTLGEIAATHLGSGGRWRELLEANRDQLNTDRDLRAGMEIRIPRAAPGSGAALPAAGAAIADRQKSGATYTVQASDSLYRIAVSKLGDGNRWREIVAMNRDKIANENEIKPGMTLVLPAR